MDDIVGLLIGPLFVMAEMGFGLGLRREVQQAIERAAARCASARHRPAERCWRAGACPLDGGCAAGAVPGGADIPCGCKKPARVNP
jgi:hypothetical protein